MNEAERLHAWLVSAIIDWASANWPAAPVFALGLGYGAGWAPVPTPGIVTAAERDELLADPDDYGVGLVLWNPGEYAIVGAFEPSMEVAELAEHLRDSWERDDDWLVFMSGLARAVAAHDWSAFTTADDFVVFANIAMDINEQTQLEDQLARCIPADRLDDFRSRGLLHVA